MHILFLFLLLISLASSTTHDDDSIQSSTVADQYTTYPYPPSSSNPSDPSTVLLRQFPSLAPPPILQAPSHLSAIGHHVFNGKIDWCSAVKILVAGGGTGEKTLQIVRQLVDSKSQSNWKVTHLDLSPVSVTKAKERIVSAFGVPILESVKFVVGSILDAYDLLPYQQFDYIDCLGVLHTLKSPHLGLMALGRLLKNDGAIGVMVYAPIGRHGIYNMQSMMQQLLDDKEKTMTATQYHLNLTRRMLKNLPETNPLKQDSWRWKKLKSSIDHATRDSSLVDLFLPAHDLPMYVDDVYKLARSAGMHLHKFVHSAQYKLKTYVHDKILLKGLKYRLKTKRQEEMFVEKWTGNIFHHFFYIVKGSYSAAKPLKTTFSWSTDLDMIPIPLRFDGEKLSRALKNLSYFPWNIHNLQVYFRLPTSIYGESDAIENVLKFIDGQRTIRVIRELSGLKEEDFAHVFGSMYEILEGQGKLFLSKHPVVGLENLTAEERETRETLYPGLPRNGYHYYDCEKKTGGKGEGGEL